MKKLGSAMPYDSDRQYSFCDFSEREPLDVSSSVFCTATMQPCGLLLIVEPLSEIVLAVSENIKTMLGIEPTALLGAHLSILLNEQDRASLLISQGQSFGLFPKPVTSLKKIASQNNSAEEKWQALVHQEKSGLLLIELFRSVEFGRAVLESYLEAAEALDACDRHHKIYELITEYVARVTGYEHVVLCRLTGNQSSPVVGEYCRDSSVLRLEEGQISAAAVKDWVKAVFDNTKFAFVFSVDATSVPVLAVRSSSWDEVELSATLLRGVSSENAEFVSAVGALSSFAVALSVEGELWGVLACFANEPRLPMLESLVLTKRLVSMVAQKIANLERGAINKKLDSLRLELGLTDEFADRPRGLQEFIATYHWMLMNWFKARGLLVAIEGEVFSFGLVPAEEDCCALLTFIESNVVDEVFCVDNIADWGCFDEDQQFSGLLALKVPGVRSDGLFVWLKSEESEYWNNTDKAVAQELLGRIRSLHMSCVRQVRSVEEGRSETLAYVLHDMGNAIVGILGKTYELKGLAEMQVDLQMVRGLMLFLSALRDESHQSDLSAKIGKVVEIASRSVKVNGQISDQRLRVLGELESVVQHASTLLAVNRRYLSRRGVVEDLSCEVSEVLEDVRLFFPSGQLARGGKFEVSLPENLPRVRICRSVLERVLINLLKNAIEACIVVGVIPQISCAVASVQTQGGHRVRIALVDNGCGFDVERNPLGLDRGISVKKRGRGLGLPGCRQLVRQVGGELSITSEGRGRGSCVMVELLDAAQMQSFRSIVNS